MLPLSKSTPTLDGAGTGCGGGCTGGSPFDRHRSAPYSHLWEEARKRERVRCSSLVDWPVYTRLRGTMQASTRSRNKPMRQGRTFHPRSSAERWACWLRVPGWVADGSRNEPPRGFRKPVEGSWLPPRALSEAIRRSLWRGWRIPASLLFGADKTNLPLGTG
jgi:hypothetical protein